ncbi:MAG: translation initiation factor IF-2 subunit gamma [Nitrososphaerota archaeon]|nr:translation initiation factor IF-2 subunit gamma [Nitrososphaerota archaeon]
MEQATETVPIRRIPKQPECNIGTSGHVDHGKCQRIDQYVLLDGVPVTGSDILRAVKTTGTLLSRVDGGEVYRFDGNSVVSLNAKLEAVKAASMFYVEDYSGPMFTVSGKSGRSLTVTPEHPLLVNRRGTLQWVKARDIRPGDYATFLSRVPLEESVSLPDPMPELKKLYEVVTWDDYERLRSLTSGFSDFSGLPAAEFEKMRMLTGLSRSRLSVLARVGRGSYSKIAQAARTPTSDERRRVVEVFKSGPRYLLRQDEFLLEQRHGRTRPIRRLRHIAGVDSDIARWFAFVWAEGTSRPNSVAVTQTVQRAILRDFLRVTEERLGQNVKSYPRGAFAIFNKPFVDYLRLRFGFVPGDETRCGIADWVCRLPKELKAAFLRAFLTLDGEFNPRSGQVMVSQLNEKNIVIIGYLLQSFGIVPRFSVKKSRTKKGLKEYGRITISGRRDLRLFADVIGFEDARVQHRLKSYLDRIPKQTKETDMSIPIAVETLRSLFRSSGLLRESFEGNLAIPNMKGAPWYGAYQGAAKTGRISRTKLLMVIDSVDQHLGAVEQSLARLSPDGTRLRRHMELTSSSLQAVASRLGYSRKKLARILRDGSGAELRAIADHLRVSTASTLRTSNAALEQLRTLAGSSLEFDKIVGVKREEYSGLVYDLAVPEYANFVAGKGATVCHNTSLVAAITGVWASAHSEELKRGITIKVGYADAAFYKCAHTPPPEAYSTSPVCPVCGQETQLLRTVSFVDSPGHESLMTNMLAGAAVMDGAILVIAANEPVPMPQTREHMLALQMLGMKKMVIVQNKIDRVDSEGARKNHEAIKNFLSGTIAADAPIIPVSAQHRINIDALIEAIEEKIPTPQRDASADARMVVLRSFDVNKPGTDISALVGGVLGGSVTRGQLSVGDEVEISPGLADDRGKYAPLITKVASLGTGVGMAEKVGPGGLVSLGTYLDPALTKGDLMVGSLLGKPGSLPSAKTHITIELQLFEQAVGSSEMLKVDKVRVGESLRLNIGTAATLGTVTSARDTVAEVDLRKPVVAEKGSRVALSRRIAERWRLIGSGIVK